MPKVTCLTKQKANLIPKLNHLTKDLKCLNSLTLNEYLN